MTSSSYSPIAASTHYQLCLYFLSKQESPKLFCIETLGPMAQVSSFFLVTYGSGAVLSDENTDNVTPGLAVENQSDALLSEGFDGVDDIMGCVLGLVDLTQGTLLNNAALASFWTSSSFVHVHFTEIPGIQTIPTVMAAIGEPGFIPTMMLIMTKRENPASVDFEGGVGGRGRDTNDASPCSSSLSTWYPTLSLGASTAGRSTTVLSGLMLPTVVHIGIGICIVAVVVLSSLIGSATTTTTTTTPTTPTT
ncbi:hypothetical protein EV368DRAFT_88426 [Lentinula lateritia]|nr:hypothetical protein EV368DRAFT_88426 [Lentinula lateritia]